MTFTESIAKTNILDIIEANCSRSFGVSLKEATTKQAYKATAMTVRDLLLQQRRVFNKKFKKDELKRVYYLSMEFLLGRSLKNNLFNLDMTNQVEEALSEVGIKLTDLYEQEPDAGLGNGGLGRLAACYLDGLASLSYPSMGHSLLFEYGLFSQKLVDGWQTELPDNWLPGGDVWLTQRADKAVTVKFGGQLTQEFRDGSIVNIVTNYDEVEAMPFDMMISGYKSEAVSVLRLWSARSKSTFDMLSFSQGDYRRSVEKNTEAESLTKILYPSDNHSQGRSLRLKQQYLLASASMQSIIADYLTHQKDFNKLSDYIAIQLNDTHPSLCIPELMRILVDEYNIYWDHAWDCVCNVFSYTNHTVLAEALEVWGEAELSTTLPRIYSILCEINKRSCARMFELTDGNFAAVSDTAIIAYNQVRMANLSVVGGHMINGVSGLHSELLTKQLFPIFYKAEPDKFTNVTNGIAHRRWLCQSNPKLTQLLTSTIGGGFIKDAGQLVKLLEYKNNKQVLSQLENIKLANKKYFSDYLYAKTGQLINPNSRFDVQVKRIHEYKRQLLNLLKIIDIFNTLKNNPDADISPQTFIFAGKAASGYYIAKEIIKLIWLVGKEIEKFPKIKEKLNVVFIENYCVTTAEALIPASEVSEQISLAGKEASGTGNMKFMINGALTLGTMDGANVEMFDACGEDNIFIFGMDETQVNKEWQRGYNSMEYFLNNPRLRNVIDTMQLGLNGETVTELINYLLSNNRGIADPYMCFADFNSYLAQAAKMDKVYRDPYKWNNMSLINIATSGIFAADRAIEEYAQRIWNLTKV